jgi:hypothetical protein
MSDNKLFDYCLDDHQRRVLRAYLDNDCSPTAASKALQGDPCRRSIQRTIQRIKKRAARAGYAPEHDMTRTTPEGFSVKGVSTYYNRDGEAIGQWVKTSRDAEDQAERMREFVAGLMAEIEPAEARPLKRRGHNDELLTAIFIGDAHIGMYAYGKETGHTDFDSDIATEQLRDAIDYLVDRAEPTETGLLVDVGDFMHANGAHDTTFAGTPLDVDTRHDAVLKKAAMVMRYMIDRMLTKFKKVVVVVAKGNHNTDSAGAVRLALDFFYSREPRVNVLDTTGFYHYVEYGKWLLGIHHGDKQKPEALAGSMARDMAEAWGRTTSRMWCVGHFHKDAVKTLPGVKYKVFGALPPPDSWHAANGYAGDGEMEMLTLRKSGGIHSSHVYHIPQPVREPDVTIL